MDISTLAASVVAVLAPYLAKAGEEFAKEVGKAAVSKISTLYQAIKDRFQRHTAASESLADLETAPNDQDAQAALRQQLKKQLADDPAFADTLYQLIDQIGQDKQAAAFLTQVYGGEVGQILNIDKVDKLDARLTIHKDK
jgi:hypothetical protein